MEISNCSEGPGALRPEAYMSNPAAPDIAHTPLPALLEVVGEELHQLAADVERLHTIVELPGVRQSLRDAQCFDVLQGIDHVTQNLAGLSKFLANIATTAPDAWTLDTRSACDAVLLAALSERLKQPSQPRQANGGGDECEFF